MFRGHCNKSIHHCSIVQQGFGCTDREVVPILSGISPGNVDGGERGVEREGKSVIGNFACTFFGKGKWTFFRKVKCTS